MLRPAELAQQSTRPWITQTLVAAKSQLVKRGLTVSRLELVSAHMTTNLVTNVRNALNVLPEPNVYGWLDSTVALHWIMGNGQYQQFVTSRAPWWGGYFKRLIGTFKTAMHKGTKKKFEHLIVTIDV